jgi:hypothetical protein
MTVSLSIYCCCGCHLRGRATPEQADKIMQTFASLHHGEGHAPCYPPRKTRKRQRLQNAHRSARAVAESVN